MTGSLLLAVEVLSPRTARYDRFTKHRLYQEFAVPQYWMADGEHPHVEVWTPDATVPVIERTRLIWTPRSAREPFVLELHELFESSRNAESAEPAPSA